MVQRDTIKVNLVVSLLFMQNLGKSTVIVAVYGPMEVKTSRKENIEKATIEVVWKPRNGLPGTFSSCHSKINIDKE